MSEKKHRRNTRNYATEWLDGKISLAKMLQELKVPRGSGDDLVGSIWQAFDFKITELRDDLYAQLQRAERDYIEALARNRIEDATAESARKFAFTEAINKLHLHLGSAIERTSHGP